MRKFRSRVVFLDRDGVINELILRDGAFVSPREFREFRLRSGVERAIRVLKSSNYLVVVVTNQPDIARCLMSIDQLSQMTEAILQIGVDEVLVCPHDSLDGCICRKPKPGLINQFLRMLEEAPESVWMVGDRESDILAGISVGARTVLISDDAIPSETRADSICSSLLHAAEMIIEDDAASFGLNVTRT